MSSAASKDGQEGSYSMYPPTSPAGPPASMQYGMGVYGNPNTFAQYGYGYPMPMDMYAGQGAPFLGYGINPNMMYYGGGSVPPPSGQKKKYYNKVENNGKTEAGNHHNNHHNGVHFYANGKSGPTSNGTAIPAASPSGASKSVPITIKNQYKFELGNANSVSTTDLKLEYPFFANTDESEFSKAQEKRRELTLRAFGEIYCGNFGENSQTQDPEVEASALESVETPVETPQASSSEELNAAEKTEKSEQSTEQEKKETESRKSSVTSQAAPTKVIKSWSAVASSAVPKASPSSASDQKKDKKYVPPTVKSLEPLGVVALRVCFDPQYVKYTADQYKGAGMALQSVIPRGIVNTGNICFMSSILQVLLFCEPFVNLMNLISVKTSAKMGSTGFLLLDACLELYRKFDKQAFEREKASRSSSGVNISSALADAIKPDDFYKTLSKLPKFKDLRWGHQEDAEEFLTHLLDQLHEEFVNSIDSLSDSEVISLINSINDEDTKTVFIRNLAKYKDAKFIKDSSNEIKSMLEKYDADVDDADDTSGNGWQEVSSTSKKGKKTKTAAKRTVVVEPSPISVIFGGQFRSVLDVPQNKEPQSITLDPFQTIQLDISDPDVNDLDSAFLKFSEMEHLPFKTSSGNNVEAKKQTFIDKLPEVFLIQLKRFSFINNTDKSKIVNYNAYSGHVEKIRKKIHYGHELAIPDATISSVHSSFYKEAGTNYKLIGVVYHHGVSPSGGHYTCDVYQETLNKWYRIDDTNVQEIEKDEVLKGGEEGNDSRTAYILIYQKL
ncbi:mRNA-binding ubiquitin-specific protease UBP3 [Lachancea thermotolerans CBS 6340]|uniref:Ubiquitin carboxyl-terminal hydrolase n=1 Tax=Lachancea thermotolerans (strain ATCC 56472 / CBS 6340 / NRRL Y-8284) TaxID=559295 RepID=C5E2S7_LACTC|nr:KLTH0H07370p [Lachancea thermotolerans CBS 6340]CAR30338.1 KLTH0H07370p [Lachancea thermotolerans CBS 6340]